MKPSPAKIPHIIIGGGSNIAFSDTGFRGRVFKLQFDKISQIPCSDFFEIETGINLQHLIKKLATQGYADLINLTGIPGDLGGAIRGNAGAFGNEISDFIQVIKYIDENGNLQTTSPKKCEFAYRKSIFKSNPDWAIVSTILKLNKPQSPTETIKLFQNKLQDRLEKNPSGRSGGSFFKNPLANNSPNTSNLIIKDDKFIAGQILDKLGSKGDQIGDIQISPQHANFFMNLGNGKQSDLIKLAQKWQTIAKEKLQVQLEPEVIVIDQFGERVL